MKIQKTVKFHELKQFLSQNKEKLNLDIQDDLSEWLENQTNYGFTIVELGFVLDLFSISPYAKTLFSRKFTSSFIDAIFAATNNLYLIAK